jgi:hypothetical protein
MPILTYLIPIVLALCVNAAIYAPLVFLGRILSRKLASNRGMAANSPVVLWALPIVVALAGTTIPAVFINARIWQQRQLAQKEDRAFDNSIGVVGSVALLLNPALKPKEDFTAGAERRHFGSYWPDSDYCSTLFCENPLIDGSVRHVLIGWQHQYRPQIDAMEKVAQFSLSTEGECTLLAAQLSTKDRRVNLSVSHPPGTPETPVADDKRFSSCFERAGAVVDQADVVVLGVPIPNTKNSQWLPGDRRLYGVIGAQLSLYKRQDGTWQEWARETHIGGSYLFMPLVVRPYFYGLFGGWALHFARIAWREPAPFDVDRRLVQWGLSKRLDGRVLKP